MPEETNAGGATPDLEPRTSSSQGQVVPAVYRFPAACELSLAAYKAVRILEIYREINWETICRTLSGVYAMTTPWSLPI